MRAICAAIAFLFAFLVVDAHLDQEVTLQPPAIRQTTISPTEHQEP